MILGGNKAIRTYQLPKQPFNTHVKNQIGSYEFTGSHTLTIAEHMAAK